MELSIITINRNNIAGLCKTVNSVLVQSVRDFEFIIIDGNSTDGSLDVIKRYNDQITYWVSEEDKGIYNAMNKGINKSTGEYCLFLNSGDWFCDEKVIEDFIKKSFKEDIVAGKEMIMSNPLKLYAPPTPEEITYEYFVEDSLMHASTFIKRKLFDKFGLYNENFKIVSDWEFLFKVLILYNCSYTIFDRYVACFDTTGISRQKYWEIIHRQERQNVIGSLLPRVNPIYSELQKLRILEQEYKNLKHGRFSYIINTIQKLKEIRKKVI